MTREEALNITKDMHHWLQTDREKEALEILIPELKESEDKRIVDDIMVAVENWHSYERVEEIRAYLENMISSL